MCTSKNDPRANFFMFERECVCFCASKNGLGAILCMHKNMKAYV